ncbi:glutathione S-transferase N-terminal domain-containing protein [Sphingomonas sp. QA11]|uniref:glutathione S-transferase family protein n=1 Tax=Sphingomonas sp. QA11 TaxID=2950605 RepID=UPI00234A6E11|nr:glutathione S-transferase N-terminal domain-containing protein [Sphingomonas sp. QA11]WCM29373.1 glutathione S-transferase N-terminal domain-containing protein [Sphingomonas sp. QA11]
MKLYDAEFAPSPRRVRIFLAEKGIEIQRVMVDLRRNEQLSDPYLAVNPRGAVPALELDDGEVICESAAICRYFEALHPEPALFGSTALDIGRIESWTRRIESDGYAAAVYAFRNVHPAFQDRAAPGKWPAMPQIPELGARGLIMWGAFVEALDVRLADRDWIATDTFSFADISALVTIDFARAAKFQVPEDCRSVARWHAAASARPSAAA